MVAPANAGYAPIGEELRDPAGIYKALLNWFRARGIDPFQNNYAQRLMTPAKLQQVALLADLEAGGNLEDSQRQDYINRWAQSQWGGGGAGYGRQDIQARMNAELGRPDSIFRTGDPDADAALMRGYAGIANATYGERRQATLDRLEAQMGANYGAWRQANPTQGGYYADWRALAQPGAPFTPPTGGGGGAGSFTPPPATGAPATNPNLVQTPSTPGNPWPAGPTQGTPPAQGASPPQGSLTPPTTNAWAPTAGRGAALDPYGGWGEVQNWQQFQANRRGHVTAPGRASVDLGGGVLYTAPEDRQRRWWGTSGAGGPTEMREPGGQKKGTSGWNLVQDRVQTNMGKGMPYQAALAEALQWIMAQGSGYGFKRVA